MSRSPSSSLASLSSHDDEPPVPVESSQKQQQQPEKGSNTGAPALRQEPKIAMTTLPIVANPPARPPSGIPPKVLVPTKFAPVPVKIPQPIPTSSVVKMPPSASQPPLTLAAAAPKLPPQKVNVPGPSPLPATAQKTFAQQPKAIPSTSGVQQPKTVPQPAVKKVVVVPVALPAKSAAAAPSRPPSTYTPAVPPDGQEIVFEATFSSFVLPATVDPRGFTFFKYLHDAVPEWRYLEVDYFLAAVELFVTAAKHDYDEQLKKKQSQNAELTSFTWNNSGGLAENFATAMDHSQSLFEALKKNASCRDRIGDFKAFETATLTHLRLKSSIPEKLLTDEKMKTKLGDWYKGGTRYNTNEESKSTMHHNVKFAEKAHRHEKVRRALIAKIQSAGTSAAGPSLFELAMQTSSQRVRIQDGETVAGRPVVAPSIRVRVSKKPDEKGTLSSSAPSSGGAQLPSMLSPMTEDERQDQAVRVALHRLIGVVRSFPDFRRSSMPQFVQLCDSARSPGMRSHLVELIQKSSVQVQSAFDHSGGMSRVHRYMGEAMQAGNQHHLIKLLEYVADLHCPYSKESRLLWVKHPTDESRNSLDELQLRSKPSSDTEVPPLLNWLREYIKKPVDGKESPLDGPYVLGLVNRFERQLSAGPKKRPLPTTAVAPGPAAKVPPRPEVGGKPKQRVFQVEKEGLLSALTELSVARALADRRQGDTEAGARLGGVGPLLGRERGDACANRPPSVVVDCLCVRCISADSATKFDPFALLGIVAVC